MMQGSDWISYGDLKPQDLSGAGIYLWQVGDDSYIGKTSRLRSRLYEYLRNVDKIEGCRPYRPAAPNAFRPVHRALHAAKCNGVTITWSVLERCPRGPLLLAAERHWITTLQPTLNGPRPIEAQ